MPAMYPQIVLCRRLAAGFTAAVSLAALPAAVLSPAAVAAPTHSKMAAHAAAPVYACKECKLYYSASAAKKMGYKDPMGHMLTRMAKAPAGYRSGGAAAGGKMAAHRVPMSSLSPMPKMGSSKMDSRMNKMSGEKK